MGFSVLYTRAPRQLDKQRIAHADGSFGRHLAQLAKLGLQLLNDFAYSPITASERNDSLEVLDYRVKTRTTLVISQLPVASWHTWLEETTLADDIWDRLVHGAHRFALKGESLRGTSSRFRRHRASRPPSAPSHGGAGCARIHADSLPGISLKVLPEIAEIRLAGMLSYFSNLLRATMERTNSAGSTSNALAIRSRTTREGCVWATSSLAMNDR